jgi:mannose-6-phosphate isomerase-like protein (cupin superfamily)
MWVRDIRDCPEFIAGDGSLLREVINPLKETPAPRYSLAWARVPARGATRPHRLASSEVYIILEGEGEMRIEAEARNVGPGQVVFIPPGARQSIVNTGAGELRFLCLVDPAWRAEDEEVPG